MPVLLTGPGGLFTRLGHIFAGITQVNTFRGTTMPARTATIQADFTTTDVDEVAAIWSQLASLQAVQAGFVQQQASLAQQILTDMVYDSAPVLPDQSLRTVMTELIRQMVASSSTVDASTATIAVTPAGTNVGNPSVIATPRITNGKMAENALAETLTATESAGSILIRGSVAVVDPLSHAWPGGSGITQSLPLIGPAGGSYLRNGDFETWAAPNDPDSWTIRVGTAGATVKYNGVAFYDGAASLEIVGNGSQLTAIDAEFGVDTANTLRPTTCYAANVWCKCSGAPAAGVLTVALVDGLGAVLNDDSGSPSSFAVSLPTLGTTFVPKGGFLRTPKTLPPVVRLRVGLSTALSAGTSLYIDRASFAAATSLYTQGPLAAGFAGLVPIAADDAWQFVVTNDRAGLFQEYFERGFRMRDSLQMLLPSNAAGGETIPDSLVV